jgi:DNA-binding transcriptional regulator YhcF (GntR family)
MSLPKPRFTGIFIPVEILELEDLSPLEQLLISWVDALNCEEHGGCFASNSYLAGKLRVQENTIAKAITHLRKIGILEDISFNGRHRVIKAKIGEFVEKSQSKAGLDLNPKQGWIKIQGSIGEKSKPSYIEKKEESKEEITSLKVSSKEESPIGDMPAKAGEIDSSSQKKKKKNHSPEVFEVTDKIIQTLKNFEAEYSPPKNLEPILTEVDFMLRLDKRDPGKIIDILTWALSDEFWRDKMFKLNPAKYLRERFLQLKNKMEAVPAKKDRKFLPSSNDAEAVKTMQEMKKRGIR